MTRVFVAQRVVERSPVELTFGALPAATRYVEWPVDRYMTGGLGPQKSWTMYAPVSIPMSRVRGRVRAGAADGRGRRSRALSSLQRRIAPAVDDAEAAIQGRSARQPPVLAHARWLRSQPPTTPRPPSRTGGGPLTAVSRAGATERPARARATPESVSRRHCPSASA